MGLLTYKRGADNNFVTKQPDVAFLQTREVAWCRWTDILYTLAGLIDFPLPSDKMPKITLHYMDFPFWRAEVARLALHLGKVDFEDHRIKDRKAWLEEGKAPYGQIPVLEVDGKIIAQT